MTNNIDSENVKKFLDDLQQQDVEKHAIISQLRELVIKLHPNVQEKIMYGGIMFQMPEPRGGVFASKNHISFEFSEGYKMSDPRKLLEGSGKLRRHLKIVSIEDIQNLEAEYFIRQMAS